MIFIIKSKERKKKKSQEKQKHFIYTSGTGLTKMKNTRIGKQ
jgi:hypothetical protein